MMKKMILGICIAAMATTLSAQETSPQLYTFYFNDSPLNAVLHSLQEITGKDITVDLGLTATVTVSTPEKVTADEAATILVQALQKEGLRLEDLDENTLRVRGTPKPDPASFDREEEAMNPQDESEATDRAPTYAERRQQRIKNRSKSADSSTPADANEGLEKQMQVYQMEVIRKGLSPLNVPLTPENAALLNSEGLSVPADAMPEEPPVTAGDNPMDK